jgi:uncharacterized membrane protein YfcA
MELTAATFILLCGISLASATVQGLTGFGFGLVSMSFCVFLLGPRDANVLVTLMSIGLTSTMWWRLRRHVDMRLVLWLLAGSLVGLPLGIWVLTAGEEGLLGGLVGLAVIAFALYSLANPHFRARELSPAWGLAAGAAGGFLSGLTSMGGPPAVIFLMLLGKDHNGLRGNLAAYFTLSVAVKIGNILLFGSLLGPRHVALAAALFVPLAAGMFVGLHASRRFSAVTLRRIVCVVLLVPGAILVARWLGG